MLKTIPVLVWIETKSSHRHRPHGCLHENGKVYTPFWARGKVAMAKEAKLREDGLI